MYSGNLFATFRSIPGASDAFSATMGRGRGNYAGVQSAGEVPQWSPYNVHSPKKEAAACFCILFGAATALLFLYCADQRSRQKSEKWAEQAWIETSCIIRALGVAYRGNCGDDVLDSFGSRHEDFSECMDAPKSEAEKRQQECDRQGDLDFATVGDNSRLLQARPNVQRRCHDGYLAWAEVAVITPEAYVHGNWSSSSPSSRRPRCAYQYGAASPSTTGDWATARGLLDKFRSSLGSSNGIKCWALAADGCVVALESAGALSRREEGSHGLANSVLWLCGSIAAVAAVLAFHWHCRDLHGLEDDGMCNDCFGVRIPAGYECSVPLEDPELEQRMQADMRTSAEADPSAVSERVRRLVDVAAARFGEHTPGASGETTLRLSEAGSRRTVEVGGAAAVPRNFAADFLNLSN